MHLHSSLQGVHEVMSGGDRRDITESKSVMQRDIAHGDDHAGFTPMFMKHAAGMQSSPPGRAYGSMYRCPFRAPSLYTLKNLTEGSHTGTSPSAATIVALKRRAVSCATRRCKHTVRGLLHDAILLSRVSLGQHWTCLKKSTGPGHTWCRPANTVGYAK